MTEKRKGATLLVTGVLLATVTLAGVFAAVVDTASSGELSIETAEVPVKNINLKIDPTARAQGSTTNCQNVTPATYVDNATTPYITITNAAPGAQTIKDFCLYNFGTDDALVTMDLVNALDVEIAACSTTETAAGDTTCTAGDAGELADLIEVGVKVHGATSGTGAGDTCDGGFNHPEIVLPARATTTPSTTSGLTSTAGLATNTLAADDAACLQVRLTYKATTTDAQRLLAQTDRVSVRLRFNGE